MKRFVIAGTGCAIAAVVITGCSGQNTQSSQSSTSSGIATESANTDVPAPGSPAPTSVSADAGHVTFGPNDAGPITAVGCQTDAGVTTISIDGSQKTTVVLTDEDTPAVKSVSIGEAGSGGPSLVLVEGITAAPQATRDGKKYTVNGTGMGTEAGNPDNPAEMPFDIAISCP